MGNILDQSDCILRDISVWLEIDLISVWRRE